MKQYVGLDISMEETSVCVLDHTGKATFQGSVTTGPEAIAEVLSQYAPLMRNASSLKQVRCPIGSGMN